jgi:NADPH2:quinone reductase
VIAVGFSAFGPPDVVEVVELPDPEPGDGEVRVRVAAATVNPTDVLLRSGRRPGALAGPPPYVGGLELCGVIDRVGPGVSRAVGERVIAMTTAVPAGRGAHAELVVVDERSVAAAPAGASDEEAATLPMNGLTARQALDRLALAAGDTLVVTGAAGAVGAYAVQLAVAEGLRVVAVAGEADEALVRELGAHEFVPRGDAALAEVRRRAPGGAGGAIDAALIGTPLLAALRDGGVLAAVREFEGRSARGIVVAPIHVREYLHEQRKLERLAEHVDRGALTLRVARVYAPDHGAAAHRAVEAGRLRGRVVIRF